MKWLKEEQGTSPSNRRLHCSVYTWYGNDIPYTEVPMLDKGMINWFKMAKKAEGYGLGRFMRFGCDLMSESLNPVSRIKVENVNADVLLLAVKDDDCWPSDIAVARMLKVFENQNYSHRVEYHVYEKGSHALTDGIYAYSVMTRFIMKIMIPAEKRFPKECEEARQDSFTRILKFIREW